MSNLKGPFSLENEEWRVYDLPTGKYVVTNPKTLWVGETTHRVLDEEGIVHCVLRNVPIRWCPRDPKNPVQF